MVTVPDYAASEAQREALRGQIDESFRKASAHQRRLKSTQHRYNLARTTLSSMTGLTAGVPAASGVLPSGNWRLVCAVAAVTAFVAAIVGVV